MLCMYEVLYSLKGVSWVATVKGKKCKMVEKQFVIVK